MQCTRYPAEGSGIWDDTFVSPSQGYDPHGKADVLCTRYPTEGSGIWDDMHVSPRLRVLPTWEGGCAMHPSPTEKRRCS